jgi:hypothetical protein
MVEQILLSSDLIKAIRSKKYLPLLKQFAGVKNN